MENAKKIIKTNATIEKMSFKLPDSNEPIEYYRYVVIIGGEEVEVKPTVKSSDLAKFLVKREIENKGV